MLVILVGLGLLMHQKEHFANMGEWERLSRTEDSGNDEKLKSCLPSNLKPSKVSNLAECKAKCDGSISCNYFTYQEGNPFCYFSRCNMEGGFVPWNEGEIYSGEQGVQQWTRVPPRSQPLVASVPTTKSKSQWERLSTTADNIEAGEKKYETSCIPTYMGQATNAAECRAKCDSDLSCNTINYARGMCVNFLCNNGIDAKPWMEGEIPDPRAAKDQEFWARRPAPVPTPQPLAAAPVSSSYNTPQPLGLSLDTSKLQPKQLMQLSELIQPNPYGYNAPWNQLNDDPLPEEEEEPEPCPKCPDMSKYIRLDEVPCWNCSLP